MFDERKHMHSLHESREIVWVKKEKISNTGKLTNQKLREHEFSSLRESTKRANPVFPLEISITIAVYWDCYLGTHAISPGTYWNGARSNSGRLSFIIKDYYLEIILP